MPAESLSFATMHTAARRRSHEAALSGRPSGRAIHINDFACPDRGQCHYSLHVSRTGRRSYRFATTSGNTRWPEKETGAAWEQGPPLTKLQRLVDYWRTDYDWRWCESELNRWPQFRTTIDGLGIHCIHVRSRHPNALPIILTHGWPSTVLLFRDVVPSRIQPNMAVPPPMRLMS
jgi:hypothetical protein